MEKITTKLSAITVSKNDMVEFQKQLSEQMVEAWNESSECKLFRGIDKARYGEFLELFQETTGISDKVLAAFKTVLIGTEFHDQLKTFKCNETDLDGIYGMYAVVTRIEAGKPVLDVAYSVFTFKTSLLGNKKKHFGLQKTEVKDVMTDEKKSNKRLKVKDIQIMTQNFIVAKALQNFADAGIIPSVRYKEEHPMVLDPEALGAMALTDETDDSGQRHSQH